METYLFRTKFDLLDLNAMEMDSGLLAFFRQQFDWPDERIGELSFYSERGPMRKIKVSMPEKLLQGRGIKGFFALYKNSDYLAIRRIDQDSVRVCSWAEQTSGVKEQAAAVEPLPPRVHQVLEALGDMRIQSPLWFELYDASQSMSAVQTDELTSLSHIRDLQPFEFQIRTVKAVMDRFKGRALLCDEVGLGKTVEAGICMMEYIIRGLAKKILILTPPSLVNQWHEEMKRKFNQDFVRSDDAAFTQMGTDAWEKHAKVIASLATAKRANHSQAIANLQYDLVIVDEAHHIKNRNTVAWKFVNSLNKKYLLLLTATPVQNSLEELYNLITLLKPGQLKTYSHFRKNFVEDSKGMEVKNTARLKQLLADVMIRNRRSTVDVTFTKRTAATRTLELSDEEKLLYADISQFIRSNYLLEHPAFSRLVLKNMQEQMGSSFTCLLGSLKKLLEHPSLDRMQKKLLTGFVTRAEAIAGQEALESAKIRELCDIVAGFGDKMLVFTKFRKTQELLVRALRDRGLAVAEFHGGMLRKEKEREVAYFRDTADVLVSTEVGGEGRNLQFCHGMVNFDLPWNPMAIEQRIGRIHRIGQKREVFVYNLAAQGTLEHHMLHVLDRKINLFELVVGEVDMILGDMEETEEFSDLIMKAWVRSTDEGMIEREMDQIGDQMLENKQRLQRIKELDQSLFE